MLSEIFNVLRVIHLYVPLTCPSPRKCREPINAKARPWDVPLSKLAYREITHREKIPAFSRTRVPHVLSGIFNVRRPIHLYVPLTCPSPRKCREPINAKHVPGTYPLINAYTNNTFPEIILGPFPIFSRCVTARTLRTRLSRPNAVLIHGALAGCHLRESVRRKHRRPHVRNWH